MNKPKLLFVYDHERPELWMDGLWAALNLLEKDFHVCWQNLATIPLVDGVGFDFMLGWGAFGSRVDQQLQKYHDDAPSGLCIAGNVQPPTGANSYDVLFYETKWYRPQISFHPNIVHAFGVNTDIFHETPDIKSDNLVFGSPVVWDYIGVGALAAWKRWEKMQGKRGNRLVIGQYQRGNEEESSRIAIDLIRAGVMVSDSVSPYDLANLYHWSRTLYMPADIYGGGERSVLEARACGLSVKIEGDNPKLQELLTCDIWDHHYYAKQLKKGIMSVL